MDAAARRAGIMRVLNSEKTVTGSSLATQLGVTRQVIVQDMAVLRAQGERVIATPRGYTVLREASTSGIIKLVAVKHDREHTKDELYAMVDLGLEVVDVIVEHPVYGQLTGLLSVSNRAEVDQFIRTIDQTSAGLLSSLTNGVHLHTVRGKDKAQFAALEQALRIKGYLLSE